VELLSALLFYAVFSFAGFVGLPIARRIISGESLAYVASKPMGWVLFGYVVWLLGSFRILDYQWHGVILGLFVIVVLAGLWMNRDFFLHKKNIKKIVYIEGGTALIYIVYLFLRSHNADINGTERFMDMALLASAGKTHFFPFLDPWFSGYTINYYYYGSYLMSLVSNIARLPYALTYNFALGMVFCQSVVLSAALICEATKSKIAAALAAYLVTMSGTPFFAACTARAFFSSVAQVCRYTTSTRLYMPSYIINEIPSYSFTVGDLHAHVLALPFFLFNIILLYSLINLKKPRWQLFCMLALGIATSGMISSWDAITLSALFGIISLIKFFQLGMKQTWPWVYSSIAMYVVVLILMWPALADFQSPVIGIGFIPSYIARHNLQNVQYPTPLLAQAGIWGIFIAGIALAFFVARRRVRENLFFVAAVVVALGVLVGVEILFVKDIYSIANPPYFRANTTFKFGFHAWILLALSFSACMAMLWNRDAHRNKKYLAKSIVAGAFAGGAIIGGSAYPYQAIQQFYLPKGVQKENTLDGTRWMKIQNTEDWDTVAYINKNILDRTVIAEAVGDSYTTYSRIATFSGMITPMGWKTHEWTWRFQGKDAERAPIGQTVETGWGAVAKVAGDIERLYGTSNSVEARHIIQKYGIAYVYVGNLERVAYPALQDEKFYGLGEVVFESGDSKLFRIILR
jgi:uncharacterized membrane protein